MNQPPVRMFQPNDDDDLQWQRLARDSEDFTQVLPAQSVQDGAPTASQPLDEGQEQHPYRLSEQEVPTASFGEQQPSRMRRRLTIIATALMLTGSVVLATAAASNQTPSQGGDASIATAEPNGGKDRKSRNSSAGAGNGAQVTQAGPGSGAAQPPTTTSSPATPAPSATSSHSGGATPTSSPTGGGTPANTNPPSTQTPSPSLTVQPTAVASGLPTTAGHNDG